MLNGSDPAVPQSPSWNSRNLLPIPSGAFSASKSCHKSLTQYILHPPRKASMNGHNPVKKSPSQVIATRVAERGPILRREVVDYSGHRKKGL